MIIYSISLFSLAEVVTDAGNFKTKISLKRKLWISQKNILATAAKDTATSAVNVASEKGRESFRFMQCFYSSFYLATELATAAKDTAVAAVAVASEKGTTTI